MLRVLIFTLVFVSSNLVIKKSFGDNNTSEFGTLQHNLCEECKFLNGQGFLRFFGLKIYQATLFSEHKSGEIFNSKFFLRIKYFREFSGKDIANKLNVAKETISRWKKIPEFQAEVNKLLKEYREETQHKLRSLINLALEVVREDLENTKI